MSCIAHRTFHGETALELAIQSRSLTTLQMLLAREVEVNRYHKGMTPLHLAAFLGWSEGAELLLSHPLVEASLLTIDGKSYLELLDNGQNAL